MRVHVSGVTTTVLLIAAIAASPVVVQAQEATITGTITDSTGAVLPGVTVTALHQATGNTFVGVTDERGAYRIPVRTGSYQITAELASFATATKRDVELLLGQQSVLNLQLAPSALQESVTVTGQAPLVDMTQSKLGGNIDTRQMEELPVNGRNWTQLALLAPGNRANAAGNVPVDIQGSGATVMGNFQINLDGVPVTWTLNTGIQPSYSRDALQELEMISNRFDATQGRSMGVQVNMITKSGTNLHQGTVSGYFRDSSLNAPDFFTHKVLPYSDQQLVGTLGGPIVKDRVHFFGALEYEREPRTAVFVTPYPSFNMNIPSIRQETKAIVRLDFQFSSQTHLTMRGNSHRNLNNRSAGSTAAAPSAYANNDLLDNEAFAGLTKIFGNRAVNELRLSYAGAESRSIPPDVITEWQQMPNILLRGFTIGKSTIQPQILAQNTYGVRDIFTLTFNKAGHHELKVGGEYSYIRNFLWWCNFCDIQINATGGPIPANLQSLFPVWNDWHSWNLAALSPITIQVKQSINIANYFQLNPQHWWGGFMQDNWQLAKRLTVNLGVRYDVDFGVASENLAVPPFLPANRPIDKNNVAPRFGFNWSMNDRTAVRGGWGLYFAMKDDMYNTYIKNNIQQVLPIVLNDGRPDFAANPYNGNPPTFASAMAVRHDVASDLPVPNFKYPYSHQASVGVERQIGTATAFTADYIYQGGRNELDNRNTNLVYNAATGANYPFTDLSHLVLQNWGVTTIQFPDGWSNYQGLQTSLTKRFSKGWQLGATYTLAGYRTGTPAPVNLGCAYPMTAPGVCNVPITLASDLGPQYSYGLGDQRHRATVNGVWQLPYGVQLSGLYFFGSGQRFPSTYGADLRQTGATDGRLLPNGTIIPRNSLVGQPLHRVDLRLMKRLPLGGMKVDGLFEVFNLFNHENYGSYVTQEAAVNYGSPIPNASVAYQPRVMQLGFRLQF